MFQSTKRVPIEDTKRFLSPEKFRDFRETGPWTGLEFVLTVVNTVQCFTIYKTNWKPVIWRVPDKPLDDRYKK